MHFCLICTTVINIIIVNHRRWWENRSKSRTSPTNYCNYHCGITDTVFKASHFITTKYQKKNCPNVNRDSNVIITAVISYVFWSFYFFLGPPWVLKVFIFTAHFVVRWFKNEKRFLLTNLKFVSWFYFHRQSMTKKWQRLMLSNVFISLPHWE